MLAISVDKLPLYPGGNPAFKIFIDKLSADMIKELEPGQRKAFVLMEYIIDENGKTIYANAISGGNEKMNLKIEKAFTDMALWTPAIRQGKNVPFKLKQNNNGGSTYRYRIDALSSDDFVFISTSSV